MPTIYQIILIALCSSFIILVLNRTEIRDYLRDISYAKSYKTFSKMVACDFCLGFWVSVVLSILFFMFSYDIKWIIVPVFSTPITRYLI